MSYAYAKLSRADFGLFRIFGAGLGNLLFPWARALIASRRFGMTPVWPTWSQLKIGPILRRENDKRLYHDLFSPTDKYLTGADKIRVLLRAPRIQEAVFAQVSSNRLPGKLVVFEGMAEYFSEMLEDHAFVFNELLKIVNRVHAKGLSDDYRGSISVHVRLGDFAASPQGDVSGKYLINTRLPMSWYVGAIHQLRAVMGPRTPVHIFSDGSDAELESLLRISQCHRVAYGSGLADLLALTRANVLLASGSTFSMWASYLGRMPVVWHPSHLRQRLYYDHVDAEATLGDKDSLPLSFTEVLQGMGVGKRERTQNSVD